MNFSYKRFECFSCFFVKVCIPIHRCAQFVNHRGGFRKSNGVHIVHQILPSGTFVFPFRVAPVHLGSFLFPFRQKFFVGGRCSSKRQDEFTSIFRPRHLLHEGFGRMSLHDKFLDALRHLEIRRITLDIDGCREINFFRILSTRPRLNTAIVSSPFATFARKLDGKHRGRRRLIFRRFRYQGQRPIFLCRLFFFNDSFDHVCFSFHVAAFHVFHFNVHDVNNLNFFCVSRICFLSFRRVGCHFTSI